MGVQGFCFCAGGGKSERMKGSIFCSKGPAMASVCGGTGFLIQKALLLTTHANLPTVSAAEGVEIQLHCQNTAKLVPHRFFLTSSVLDLTIVGFDVMDPDSMLPEQKPHHLKTCSNPSLELGSAVYLLGHTNKEELTVGDGKVVIATDNLIKVSTDGVMWRPGSAGFDAQGNLAFMVCDPMKLASSPTTKSSSTTTSSSSSRKDQHTQFGMPLPVICQWLNQHWEGSLDEPNKPKLPLMRLMSTGQKSEPSSASFALRRVFKSTEEEEEDTLSSHICSMHVNPHASSNFPTTSNCQDESHLAHEQGIPTPEIYESPMLTAFPVRMKENPTVQLLDINFPPNNPKASDIPESSICILNPPNYSGRPSGNQVEKHPCNHSGRMSGNRAEKPTPNHSGRLSRNQAEKRVAESSEGERSAVSENPLPNPLLLEEPLSIASNVEEGIPHLECVEDTHSEVQSSSPVELSEMQDMNQQSHADYSSDEDTMYSASTRESRNYNSPREERSIQGSRSQSCVNQNRWSGARRSSVSGQMSSVGRQSSLSVGKKPRPPAAPYRGHDIYTPTVSSIMKKRNSTEQPQIKPRLSAVQLSPRWMF